MIQRTLGFCLRGEIFCNNKREKKLSRQFNFHLSPTGLRPTAKKKTDQRLHRLILDRLANASERIFKQLSLLCFRWPVASFEVPENVWRFVGLKLVLKRADRNSALRDCWVQKWLEIDAQLFSYRLYELAGSRKKNFEIMSNCWNFDRHF